MESLRFEARTMTYFLAEPAALAIPRHYRPTTSNFLNTLETITEALALLPHSA